EARRTAGYGRAARRPRGAVGRHAPATRPLLGDAEAADAGGGRDKALGRAEVALREPGEDDEIEPTAGGPGRRDDPPATAPEGAAGTWAQGGPRLPFRICNRS